MRIQGPNAAQIAGPVPAARRSAAGTFTLSDGDPSRAAAGPVALRTVGGIDALIALQGLEDPAERRRKAVKHGRRALDALDALKLGLLAGALDQTALLRLKSAATDLKASSGDENLDGIMAAIDLRVEVELAKAGLV